MSLMILPVLSSFIAFTWNGASFYSLKLIFAREGGKDGSRRAENKVLAFFFLLQLKSAGTFFKLPDWEVI